MKKPSLNHKKHVFSHWNNSCARTSCPTGIVDGSYENWHAWLNSETQKLGWVNSRAGQFFGMLPGQLLLRRPGAAHPAPQRSPLFYGVSDVIVTGFEGGRTTGWSPARSKPTGRLLNSSWYLLNNHGLRKKSIYYSLKNIQHTKIRRR